MIVLAAALAYANSFANPFLFDDDASIVKNATIRTLQPSVVLFPERETPVAGRPLVNVSFALTYALDRLDVRAYHIGNIAVHTACALLLFGLVRRTVAAGRFADGRNAAAIALAVALLWLLHPLNTEAVDYLTQRTESLMACFYLLTLYAAARAYSPAEAGHHVRPDRSVRLQADRRWHGVSVVACALGMLCKESMVTAPVAVLLYDRTFAFDSLRAAVRARWRVYLALFATWGILAAVLASNPRPHSAGFSTPVDVRTYLLNQAVMIARYLRLAVWPNALVLHYGLPVRLALNDVLPAVVLIAALAALTIVALVRWPTVGFAGAWFFLTLAPASSIVPIATEVGAERRMYLPLAGLIALAVVAASRWLEQRGELRRVGAPLLAAVALAFGYATVARNREYATGITMAGTIVDRWPTAVAHAMLGTELAAAGRHDEALPHLRTAAPSYPKARYHLGGELFNAGRLDEAIPELQEFVRLDPQALECVNARTMLGRAFMLQHKPDLALEQLKQVLAMSPSNVVARGFLADVLFERESYVDAIAHYRVYLASRPDDAGAMTNVAVALARSGNTAEAIDAFRHVVAASPQSDSAERNLAAILIDHGDPADAAAHARRAVSLNPGDAAGHDLYGRALLLQGRREEARKAFERALEIDPSFAPAQEGRAVAAARAKR